MPFRSSTSQGASVNDPDTSRLFRSSLTYGGTDTSSIQMSRAGCKAVALSIPTRYIHTGVEMIDMNDVSACVDLTLVFDADIEA